MNRSGVDFDVSDRQRRRRRRLLDGDESAAGVLADEGHDEVDASRRRTREGLVAKAVALQGGSSAVGPDAHLDVGHRVPPTRTYEKQDPGNLEIIVELGIR